MPASPSEFEIIGTLPEPQTSVPSGGETVEVLGELPPQQHPLLGFTAQQLADDPEFDPLEYAGQNYADLYKDRALMERLAEADQIKKRKPVTLSDAGKLAKGAVVGAIKMAAAAPRMGQNLTYAALSASPVMYPLLALAGEDPSMAGPMAKETALNAAASFEQAQTETGMGLKAFAEKAIVQPMVRDIQLKAVLVRAAAEKAGMSQLAAAADSVGSAVSDYDPLQQTGEKRLLSFLEEVTMRRTLKEAGEGSGMYTSAALEAIGTDLQQLRQEGIEIDPEMVEDLKLVTDVTEYIPVAKGFAVVARGGKTLLTAPTKALAAKGLAALRTAGAKTSRAAATVAGAAAKVPPGVGAVAGVLVGEGTGALGGLAAPRLARAAEQGFTAAGEMFEGTRKIPGADTLKAVAGSAPVQGLVKGAGAALSPELDNVVPLMAAAGAGDAEQIGEAFGSTAAFGALGGGAAGTMQAGGKAVTSAAEAVVRKRFEEVDREPVAPIVYGTEPELDTAHTAQMAALQAADPKAANRLNFLRATALPRGSEMYLLPNDLFSVVVARETGAAAGTQFSTPGLTVTRPDGSTRVYLNEDATALGHETGHALIAAMTPEARKGFLDSVFSAYGPQQIAQFGAYYDSLLGRQEGAEGSTMRGNAERTTNEVAAEMLTKALHAEPLNNVSPTLTRRIWAGLASLAEATSLYQPQVGQVGNPDASALGVTPSVAASDTAMEFLRNAQTDPNWMGGPRPPVLPPEAPAPTAPAAPAESPTGGAPRISRRRFITGGLASDRRGTAPAPETATAVPTPGPAPAAPVAPPVIPEAPPVIPPPLPATPPAAPPVIPEPEAPPRTSAERLARLRQQAATQTETPAAPNMRVTPEQQAEVDVQRRVSGAAEAETAVAANPTLYDRVAQTVFRAINAALQRPQGQVAPVRITYRSVTPTAGGQNNARVRKEEQDAAYEAERALGGLPSDVRSLFDKVTVPYRWVTRGENVNVLAMSMDKVLANLNRTVTRAAAVGAAADLVPYELTPAATLTPAAARQFAADLRSYTANQANGYAGSGASITVPAEYRGDIPEQNPNYRPTTIDQRRADFINLLMAISPPATARVTADARRRGSIPNVEARKLAEANTRPVVTARTARPGAAYPADTALGTTAPTPIAEPNPLRDEFARRGIDLTGRNLFQVTEELDLQNIQSVQPAAASGFRAPSKDLVQAGFMPYAGTLGATKDQDPRGENLRIAKDMEAAGRDPELIRIGTGWFRGPVDNKWRIEVPDNVATWSKYANRRKNGPMQRLGDILEHPELFATYPELREVPVTFRELLPRERGNFNPDTKEIQLNSTKSEGEQLTTLVHEIQHWIQNKEGFLPGSSPQEWYQSDLLSEPSYGPEEQIDADNIEQALTRFRAREAAISAIWKSMPDSEKGADKNKELQRETTNIEFQIRDLLSQRAKLDRVARSRTATQKYFRTAGEVEARDAGERRGFSAEQRANTPPYATQPVSSKEMLSRPYFMPRVDDPTFRSVVEDVASGKMEGITLNPDGSVFEPGPGEQLDVVTLGSVNIPADELTPERVHDEMLRRAAFLQSGARITPGLFRMSTPTADGRPQVSIDFNTVVSQQHRENTVAFARANNQEAIFDLVTFESVPTGGNGDTTLTNPVLWGEAAVSLNEGAPVDVAGLSRRASASFMPEVDQDLVALHNTSERGLREALRLGGIPLPSLAVTRKDIPFSGYGDITLIAPRRVVDPEADPSNRVFAADAYTVRQPRPEVRPDGSRVIPGTEIPYTLENVAAYMERPDPRGQVQRDPDKPFPDVSKLEELRTVGEMRSRKSGLVPEFDSDGDTTDRGYFEAKPQRPVRLSEFLGAVVPENLDPELVQQLRSIGLEVETYGRDPGQRRETVETVAERTAAMFMPTAAEYEARRALDKAAANKKAPLRVAARDVKPVPAGTAQLARKGGPLPAAVSGRPDIRAVRYSSRSGSTVASPKNFGRGSATATDSRGIPKVYFYEENSPTGADRDVVSTKGKVKYGARLSTDRLYDVMGEDPLNYLGTPNREKADQALIDAGYAGLRIVSGDRRKIIALFEPVAQTELGTAPKNESRASVPKGAPQFMPVPPSDEVAKDALSVDRQPKFGKARGTKPGTAVGLRVDIPAFLRTGHYVVSIHEKAASGRVGKILGYDTKARVLGPTFFVNENKAELIRDGEAKSPIATVEGTYTADQSIPEDLSGWLPVGMNPKKHSYFYDKETDRPVVSGSEAVLVGNTVFVKDPVFGEAADFRFMPAPALDTPEFKRWFGNSKVVNPDGTPKAVYHGMAGELEGSTFRESKYGAFGRGVYFTDSPDVASDFAVGKRAGLPGTADTGAVVPAYLALEAPFTDDTLRTHGWDRWLFDNVVNTDTRRRLDDRMGSDSVEHRRFLERRVAEGTATVGDFFVFRPEGKDYVSGSQWDNDLNKVIRDAGFDGIIGSTPKGFTEYVAFRPTQIKSATGNTGAFDGTNPDIRFMPSPKPGKPRISRTRADVDVSKLPPGQAADLQYWVSTRMPDAKGAERDGFDNDLVIEGPDILEANTATLARGIKKIPGMEDLRGSAEEVFAQFKQRVIENLLYMHDSMPAAMRLRAKLWYEGARTIAEDMSSKYGVPVRSAAAVLATLSPQKDWRENVDMGYKVLQTVTQMQQRVLPAVAHQWLLDKADRMPEEAEKGIRKTDSAETAEEKRESARKSAEVNRKAAAAIQGLTFEATPDDLKPFWLRSYWESEGADPYVKDITPEGVILDQDAGVTLRWQSYDVIAKAIEASSATDRETISDLVGGMHKVRSFYNNILLPALAELGDVTIDTHAIAAGLFAPMSSSAEPVQIGLGGKGSSSKLSGSNGLYGLYADAYREAAVQRGLMAREMQSIVWEAVRALFLPPFRRNKKLKAASYALLSDTAKGTLSHADSRKQIEALAGGYTLPAWFTGVAAQRAAPRRSKKAAARPSVEADEAAGSGDDD